MSTNGEIKCSCEVKEGPSLHLSIMGTLVLLQVVVKLPKKVKNCYT